MLCAVPHLRGGVPHVPPNYKANRIEMEERAKAAKQRQQDIQRAIEELDTKEALARANSSFASNKDKAE